MPFNIKCLSCSIGFLSITVFRLETEDLVKCESDELGSKNLWKRLKYSQNEIRCEISKAPFHGCRKGFFVSGRTITSFEVYSLRWKKENKKRRTSDVYLDLEPSLFSPFKQIEMIEVFLFGEVFLFWIVAGLFVTAYLKYKRGDPFFPLIN